MIRNFFPIFNGRSNKRYNSTWKQTYTLTVMEKHDMTQSLMFFLQRRVSHLEFEGQIKFKSSKKRKYH